MGKRKRGSALSKTQEKPSEYEDRSAARITHTSLEDLADSEDEFLSHRDKVLLGDRPETKRRKAAEQEEDDFLEPSDEEVLGYSEDASEEDDDDNDFDDEEATGEGAGGEQLDYISDGDEDERDDAGNWGSRKSDYYNTDAITNEEEALEEEAEARRIQQRRLQKLTEADFVFDEDQWAGATAEKDDEDEQDEDGVVVEKLPPLELRDGMSDADKRTLFKRRYPEIEGMAKDLISLRPLWEDLRTQIKNVEADSDSADVAATVLKTQYRALSAYMGALAMAFAVLTSTAASNGNRKTDKPAQSLPMQPHELREHGVLNSVDRCRTTWEAVKDIELSDEDSLDEPESEHASDSEDISISPDKEAPSNTEDISTPQITKESAALEASRARRAARLQQTEASLATLEAQLAAASTREPRPSKSTTTAPAANDAYDLGDAAPLDAHTAADKARRKKSLRFYTSRIAQAAGKTANAARPDGDDDLPHRERFRDRSERLMREAEARGRKGRDTGIGLDEGAGSDDDGGDAETNMRRRDADDDDDEYAALLHGRAAAKKEAKRAREAAYGAAKAAGATVERYEAAGVGPDGRREIGYAIQANKGLTPHRKKDVRNPRVKKRRKYEDKTKKLRSMKATFKGGEGRGGYGGELTGIKKGLVKSVKL